MKALNVICIYAVMIIFANNATCQEPGRDKKQIIVTDTVWVSDYMHIQQRVVYEEEQVDVIEQMPTFWGGDLNKFGRWVGSMLRYPNTAAEYGISSKVVVTFVIDRDGTLGEIELKTPPGDLANEVIRVLKLSPKWKPGKQDGIPAKVRFTLPVDFKLSDPRDTGDNSPLPHSY